MKITDPEIRAAVVNDLQAAAARFQRDGNVATLAIRLEAIVDGLKHAHRVTEGSAFLGDFTARKRTTEPWS
jgi:hypothetical protein